MLVEDWYKVQPLKIDPTQVAYAVPHTDNHAHVAFGRAAAWDLQDASETVLHTVNGCPKGLEDRVPQEYRHLI
ncbi:MAG: hypothetical protein JWO78_1845 [Micavibrio sp.]|nr:hypothetical protein [Micavibrio sp.]